MFSGEINYILEKDKIFKGTFSCDKVSGEQLGKQYIIVVNTVSSENTGEHWVLFYQPNKHNIIWFDSLANKFESYSTCFTKIFHKLTKNKQIIKNEQALQSDSSNLCGVYCIYFAIHLALGKDINTIIGKFSRNKLKNDQLICNWFKKYIRINSHTLYKIGQNCLCKKLWKK